MRYTPFIKESLLFTTQDHPRKMATVCFVDVSKCNLSCVSCHNKHVSSKRKKLDFFKKTEFLQNIKNSIKLGTSELLIISGGEPTLHTDALITEIEEIKQIHPDIKIRIDTNGQLPEQVSILKNHVDGFAVDIKIPPKDNYISLEIERYCKIIGIPNVFLYRDKLLETIDIVDGMPSTIFRTVKYSLFTDEDIEEINNFVESLKSPHFWNDFLDLDE